MATGKVNYANIKYQSEYDSGNTWQFNDTYVRDHSIRIVSDGCVASFQGWMRLKDTPPSGTIIATGFPAAINEALIMGFDQTHTNVCGVIYTNTGNIVAAAGVDYASHIDSYINFNAIIILNY